MILLLGSSGYVGRSFQKHLGRKSISWTAGDWRLFESHNRGALINRLLESGVTFILNCAGYTGKPNVDACETDKASCLHGNAVLPGMVCDVCEELDIGWGHVSSGCIYQGQRPGGGGWRENDAPNFSFRRPPCSFYSGTKALGEEILGWREADRASQDWPLWEHESEPTGYVWRLRIPFDEFDGERNYLSKIQRYDTLLEARNSLSQLSDFVSACWKCVEMEVPYGIYNVTNPGSVSTSEVADLIRKTGIASKVFKYFESEKAFMEIAAKTPRSNCILDTSKLEKAGIAMRPVEEALEWSLKHWKAA